MFSIKKGLMYQTTSPMGVSGRGFQGANFFTAPNPTYGAVFTFHLKDELKTKKGERIKKDRELSTAKKDSPYPSWEALKEEDREVAPSRWLIIRDAAGAVVRKIPTTTDKGMVRANWDFRHAGSGGGRRGGGGGPVAVPGKYTVEVAQMVEGVVSEVIPKTEFEIEPLTFGDTSEINRAAIHDFSKQLLKLANAVNAATQSAAEASEQLTAIEALTKSASEVDPTLWKDIRALQVRLMDVTEKFTGDATRERRNEDSMPGLQGRLMNAMMGAMGSTTGPTGTHRRQFEIAGEEFESAMLELKQLLDTDIPAMLKRLDEMGAPWTPGRGIPKWK
jgi:hypothetical protein